MKIEDDGATLRVSDLSELSALNAAQFREQVQSALSPSVAGIELDLAGTQFVDSCGLASLCSLRAGTEPRGIVIRLLNPEPPVHQLLELTQMHELFEIVSSDPVWTDANYAAAPEPLRPGRSGVSTPLQFL
jgi:anti-sigma B factor antagonist